MSRIVGGTAALGKRNKLSSVHYEAARIGEDAPVQVIEQVKRFNEKGEVNVVCNVEITAEAAVGGAVGWSNQ